DDAGAALPLLGVTSSATSLGFGFYKVVATRKTGVSPGSGCVAAPVRIEVKDKRVYPAATLTAATNTSCDGVFEGSIKVEVSDAATIVASPKTFGYSWTLVSGGNAIATSAGNDGDGTGADDNFS